ncbi:hypothetical protein OH782_28795 [Streptomyces sp. NBC_01544]|uniref:trypco2 family protein n=1 Tax=Streptomyces sp. NBC_01544 TaxID=2975871 RepID=UPI00386C8634
MDIPLVAAVAAVRDELISAAAAGGSHPDLVFAVGPVEMEFEVEIRADASVKAGFRLWAVGAEAKAGISRGRTHRVKFTLTPLSVNGGDLLVSSSADRAAGPGDASGRIED